MMNESFFSLSGTMYLSLWELSTKKNDRKPVGKVNRRRRSIPSKHSSSIKQTWRRKKKYFRLKQTRRLVIPFILYYCVVRTWNTWDNDTAIKCYNYNNDAGERHMTCSHFTAFLNISWKVFLFYGTSLIVCTLSAHYSFNYLNTDIPMSCRMNVWLTWESSSTRRDKKF